MIYYVMKRNYLSIYFPLIDGRGKRRAKNVCIAFNDDEAALYRKLKELNSRNIKKAAGIFTYRRLTELSEKENRKPTELLKLRLGEKLMDGGRLIQRNVEAEPAQVRGWIEILKKKDVDGEIIDFLEGIISDEGGETTGGKR